MAAPIKGSEISWSDSISIKFGFTGLSILQTTPIIRQIIQANWPIIRRRKQCVYIIRLSGNVAVSYADKHSPVIYIGEGNAYDRLYNHAAWLASLLVSVPNLSVNVHIAEVARKNHQSLYQYIEADMIKWFAEKYGMLPWFNQQRERSKEGHYVYHAEAEKKLRQHLLNGSGNSFLWSIRPTKNNDQYSQYRKGIQSD